MPNLNQHLIKSGEKIIDALVKLNILAEDGVLFIVDKELRLIGSLTDGDIRRALIKGISVECIIDEIIETKPKYLNKDKYDIRKVIEFRKDNYRVLPILNDAFQVVDVLNFRLLHSYLPVDAVIMAGGRGQRLKPLTDLTPKPLLKVGDKPIIEHNIRRLALYGIKNYWISVNYLGEQIEEYFGCGEKLGLNIKYVHEDKPLGTVGAVSKIKEFNHEYILITNSDILTNLDYEGFFLSFINDIADFAVAAIPYHVDIPYAVLETNNGRIIDFKEKPTYTYYSNGGIYLMKRAVLDMLPQDNFFNATDLMELLIKNNLKVVSYPVNGYWLDIGKNEDYIKAQEDIKHIKFHV
jgi:dTDP-glucose pyrophosphorylase